VDLERIHTAVAAYVGDAAPADAARLEFFEGLYGVLDERAKGVAAAGGYTAPSAGDLREILAAGTPVFSKAPVAIDAGAFGATCAAVAAFMADHAGLEETAAAALRAYDWARFAERADLGQAGSDPTAFVNGVLANLGSFDVPADLPANLCAMTVMFALRAHLESASNAVRDAIERAVAEGGEPAPASIDCPVCGSPASASWVGNTGDTSGSGRRQYCAQCGAQWHYDRVRCGRCGTRNQGHLHYTNVEGDRAHRLQTCDECDDYERVVFQEDLPAGVPLVMEVEDVAMAPLDAIAQQREA
jgi:FdhE protein